MQPIKEFGGDSYFTKMCDINGEKPKLARSLGNVEPGDGNKYPRRGFVQVTGKRNCADWSKRLGINLIDDADLALHPKYAAIINFEGMIGGTFSGKRLQQYFKGSQADWIGARSIVNPCNRAQMIANYARKFYAATS